MGPPSSCRKKQTDDPSSSTTSRKRSRREVDREKLQQYGVDLPEIPGLPVPLIPLHVHAVKTTLASIKQDYSKQVLRPKSNDDAEQDDIHQHNFRLLQEAARQQSAQSATNNGNLMETLMSRVQQATDEAQQDPEVQQAIDERTNKRHDAVKSWLQALRREIRNDKSDPTRIPVATMNHLWESASDHKRISARRTALFLAGSLLQKSAAARQWLLETNYDAFSQWLDALVNDSQKIPISSNNSSSSSKELARRLWQREAYLWITQLLEEGHGDLYPRLAVARQRLEQDCPWVGNDPAEEEALIHVQNMTTWRKWRDLAMQYAAEEEKRVNRLLEICANCVDVLVPSVTRNTRTKSSPHNSPAVSDQAATDAEEPNGDNDQLKANTDHHDSDIDDEDDIDWEDGLENGEDEPDLDPASHQDAVERTLQAMQARKATDEGTIQIDLNPQQVDRESEAREETEEAQQAKLRLTKCIRFLSLRHLPRLTHWMDGLTKADSLQTIPESGAMMELGETAKRQRRDVSDKLMELKTRITAALSSAKRLGLDVHSEGSNGEVGASSSITPMVSRATVQRSVQSSRAVPRRVVIRYANRKTKK